ncbi:4000_t:CDS:2 [Dentiscutata heterogama]|uniref:4000_t:CDS:1 n=1 Tax=Dentiscutata heterogama TaxID=1316150 RepID=A0ACA9KIZ7_9GLOM|nr:4000_t:CDS:2 [Dentiscutata heterogama]
MNYKFLLTLLLALATINVVAIASPHYRREASPLLKKREECTLDCTGYLQPIEECLEYCDDYCMVFDPDYPDYAVCCFLLGS